METLEFESFWILLAKIVDPIGDKAASLSPVQALAVKTPDDRPEEPKSSDERIARAAAGDRRAAESLFMELLPRVRNLVRYLVRGDGDVDDIAQEALVSVFRGLGSYRGDGKFESWVDRIVARTTFAWLRKSRKDPAGPNYSPDLTLVGAGTDEYMARRRVARLLDRLPTEQRHSLVLHHVMGLSVKEVAGELDVPQETIRSRLRLAKQRLLRLEQAANVGGGSS